MALHNAGQSVVMLLCAVVVLVALGVDQGSPRAAAFVGIAGGIATGHRWWLARQKASSSERDLRKAVRQLEANALLSGSMWCVVTFVIYPRMTPAWASSYLLFICGSLMLAALFMPLAGRAFVILMTCQLGALAVVSLTPGPQYAPPIAVLMAVFAVSLYRAAGTVAQRAVSADRHAKDLEAANDELQRMRDAAVAADVAKSQFLATMSHEIRTPLHGVLGSLELLSTTELTSAQRQLVTTSETSGRTLLTLLDDVLDHSAIEAGSLRIVSVPFALTNAVEHVGLLFRASAECKGISLEVVIEGRVPRHVQGDEQRLKQVLMNLVGNAVKFTEAGHVELKVVRVGGTQDRHLLRFEVCDTGVGIDESRLPQLFSPFQQGSSDTTRRFGGSGLGLAISQRIIQQMGGEIRATAMPEGGSCFSFELGLGRADAPPSPVPESAVVPPPTGTTGRVLLVEDNEVNALIALQMLHQMGVPAVRAVNGQEAVALVRAGGFDLILMDCQMPVLDGYGATRAIRAQEAERGGPRVPILAITAHYDANELRRVQACGMDGCISKPFDMATLRHELARWIPSSGGGAATGTGAAPREPPGD